MVVYNISFRVMEALNDDKMNNKLTHTEELVSNECRVCLKSSSETYQLFRDDCGIPEKLMAVGAVQVSCCACLFYFESPISVLENCKIIKLGFSVSRSRLRET